MPWQGAPPLYDGETFCDTVIGYHGISICPLQIVFCQGIRFTLSVEQKEQKNEGVGVKHNLEVMIPLCTSVTEKRKGSRKSIKIC